MHPHPAFAWHDEGEMRAFVRANAFAQIVAVDNGMPIAAYAPLECAADGPVRFHLARGNRLTPRLDGAPVLASIVGPHGYISPDWYGTADQVPTWNYQLVEIEGRCRRLDPAELPGLLDELSAAQEARLAPKPAWTSAKMDPRRHAAMLTAIVGFAIDEPALRGVRKLGQNKSDAEAGGAVAALRGGKADALADAMTAVREP